MSIKAIRKELGLSQREFAHLFGVHQTAVSQWETGRTMPETEIMIQIARATNHSMDEILDVHTGKIEFSGAGKREIMMPDDSMAGARIRKGDTVYICKSEKEYEDASLIGVQRKSGNTVRYLRVIGAEKYLSDAQTPAVIEKMSESDRILGIVYGFYANLKEV